MVVKVCRGCLVALDIDGTLIPLLIDFETLRARVRALLGVSHPLRPLAESLASLPVDRELKEEAWRLIEEAEVESVERIDLRDVSESVECVKKMVSLGVGVVFVTARSSRTAELVLSRLGLTSVAESLISRDVTPYRVEQLKHVLKLSKGRRVVFVADTRYDEEAAEALGLLFLKVESYRELPHVLNKVIDICRTFSQPSGLPPN
ncbi:MAG: HAD family hydrolase [Zestosphaera sp.]